MSDDNGRSSNGRFAAGNKISPGRRSAKAEANAVRFGEIVGPERFDALCELIIERALKGVFCYVKLAVELLIAPLPKTISLEDDRETLRFAGTLPEEIDAIIAARLAARKRGKNQRTARTPNPGTAMLDLSDFTTADILAAAEDDPVIAQWLEAVSQSKGLMVFQPRPDSENDQQTAFYESRDEMAIMTHGNASGSSEVACAKVAKFLLREQPAPRRDTPYWIIAPSYELCIDTLWTEKLYGHGHVPSVEVDWARITYLSAKSGQVKRVPLRPWPGQTNGNWCLEFHSAEQGRSQFQAKSVGGFLFSEQFDRALFNEVWRATRDYHFPGSRLAEFCPIDAAQCRFIEQLMREPPPGFRFYRCSTLKNPYLAEGFLDQFIALIPFEMRGPRLSGSLASYEGAIFVTYGPHNITTDDSMAREPGIHHYAAVDFGTTLAAVWGCQDLQGRWVLYDEYQSSDQGKTAIDHGAEIAARSMAHGWPAPSCLSAPTEKQKYFARKVQERLKELSPSGHHPRHDQHHGPIYGDPEDANAMRELREVGLPVVNARKDVIASIDRLRTLIQIDPFTEQPKLRIHERCHGVQEQIASYRWDVGKVKAQPVKEADHLVDAARYLTSTAPPPAGPTKTRMEFGPRFTPTPYVPLQRAHR